jgi:ribosomal protein bL25 (Ctc-form)
METVLLSVNIKDLEQVFKQGNAFQVILNLVIQNGKKVTKAAMVKELQTHPVSGNFIHIDFYEIDMKRQINVMVPIITNGQSVGVENGGMLNIVRREIELLCLPGDIPEAIEIDITDLDIGDSIHILILRWLPYLARRLKKKRWLKKRKANSRTVKKQRAKRLGKPTNPQRKNSSNGRLESPAHSCDQIQMWRRPSSLLL